MAPLIVLLLLVCVIHSAADLNLNGYIDKHPCEKSVCVQIWRHGRVELAIVTDGQIQADDTQAEWSKCRMPVRSLDNQDGFCMTTPCEPGLDCAPFTPVISAYPGHKTSLQCVLLSSLASSSCFTRLQNLLEVQWVDENGNPVEGGPEYRITQNRPCDVSLTVSLRSPRNASFRCSARVSGRSRTSQSIQVRLPHEREETGGPSVVAPSVVAPSVVAPLVVAPAVGVLCAVLVVAAALFVLNKRRTNTRTSSESHTSAADYVLDPDEVVYADVVFLASSDRVCASVNEPTVYACVR